MHASTSYIKYFKTALLLAIEWQIDKRRLNNVLECLAIRSFVHTYLRLSVYTCSKEIVTFQMFAVRDGNQREAIAAGYMLHFGIDAIYPTQSPGFALPVDTISFAVWTQKLRLTFNIKNLVLLKQNIICKLPFFIDIL